MRDYTFDEAFALAESGLSPVPNTLLSAALPTRNEFYPSASVIGGCLRQFELKKEVPYFTPIGNALRMVQGTAAHAMWESQPLPAGVLGDTVRLHGTLDLGIDTLPAKYRYVELTGQPDYLDPHGVTYKPNIGSFIRDYKGKSGYVPVPGKFFPPLYNRVQANIYNWLWVQQGNKSLDFWELVYYPAGGDEPRTFRGPLRSPHYTERWLQRALTQWALRAARLDGETGIVDPIPSFYIRDEKGPKGLCSVCEVRNVCEARWLQSGGSLTIETTDENPT